jgi:hypothetical protein
MNEQQASLYLAQHTYADDPQKWDVAEDAIREACEDPASNQAFARLIRLAGALRDLSSYVKNPDGDTSLVGEWARSLVGDDNDMWEWHKRITAITALMALTQE